MYSAIWIIIGVLIFFIGGTMMPSVLPEISYNRYSQDHIDKKDTAMIIMVVGVIVIISGVVSVFY
jgi:uncharacterized membrane protein